jgi:hypothetical protein
MVALVLTQAAIVVAFPNAVVIGLGIWWNSNTIAHYFVHRPFFQSRVVNAAFALFQSALLGIPQALWRDRHLAHHAGIPARVRWSWEMLFQISLILSAWGCLAYSSPEFFVGTYVPGYVLGLGICFLHGHFEHSPRTVSHYGWLYNTLLLNDGYHVEHHRQPSAGWRELPSLRESAGGSAWPAPLRWMEWFGLEGLERLVLRSTVLQGWMVHVHRRAFRDLPAHVSDITVVGGALFPRTVMVLRTIAPNARVTVLDGCAANIATASALVSGVEFIHREYDGGQLDGCELLVIPLSFRGDFERLYERPPAPLVLVQDWIWRKRGESRVVSWLLLKRVNLVRR